MQEGVVDVCGDGRGVDWWSGVVGGEVKEGSGVGGAGESDGGHSWGGLSEEVSVGIGGSEGEWGGGERGERGWRLYRTVKVCLEVCWGTAAAEGEEKSPLQAHNGSKGTVGSCSVKKKGSGS